MPVLLARWEVSNPFRRERGRPFRHYQLAPCLTRLAAKGTGESTPEVLSVLVPIHSVIPVGKAPIEMMVENDEIVPLPHPLGVPLGIPRIMYVEGEVGPADGSKLGDGGLVPALNAVVVGRLIEELEADDVGDGGEVGGEKAEGLRCRCQVLLGGEEVGLAGAARVTWSISSGLRYSNIERR